MIGNNMIVLNTATMIEAVQFWLNSKMPTDTPKVVDVRLYRHSSLKEFEVLLHSTAPQSQPTESAEL